MDKRHGAAVVAGVLYRHIVYEQASRSLHTEKLLVVLIQKDRILKGKFFLELHYIPTCSSEAMDSIRVIGQC